MKVARESSKIKLFDNKELEKIKKEVEEFNNKTFFLSAVLRYYNMPITKDILIDLYRNGIANNPNFSDTAIAVLKCGGKSVTFSSAIKMWKVSYGCFEYPVDDKEFEIKDLNLSILPSYLDRIKKSLVYELTEEDKDGVKMFIEAVKIMCSLLTQGYDILNYNVWSCSDKDLVWSGLLENFIRCHQLNNLTKEEIFNKLTTIEVEDDAILALMHSKEVIDVSNHFCKKLIKHDCKD